VIKATRIQGVTGGRKIQAGNSGDMKMTAMTIEIAMTREMAEVIVDKAIMMMTTVSETVETNPSIATRGLTGMYNSIEIATDVADAFFS
jgi:hypothetical protein